MMKKQLEKLDSLLLKQKNLPLGTSMSKSDITSVCPILWLESEEARCFI